MPRIGFVSERWGQKNEGGLLRSQSLSEKPPGRGTGPSALGMERAWEGGSPSLAELTASNGK